MNSKKIPARQQVHIRLYQTAIETPIGMLRLYSDDRAVHKISFSCTRQEVAVQSPRENARSLLAAASEQLWEYFAGQRQSFDLPLAPMGTDFQQAVWQLIRQIPFGETKTYGELAALLGNPNKARAVGGAANKNPLPLLIPCHRVMGSGGKLTGFAAGLEIKKFLLKLEQPTLFPTRH